MSDVQRHTHPPEPEDYRAHLRDFHGYSKEAPRWYGMTNPEQEHGDDHFYHSYAFDPPAPEGEAQ